jgi:hypothetical protein
VAEKAHNKSIILLLQSYTVTLKFDKSFSSDRTENTLSVALQSDFTDYK